MKIILLAIFVAFCAGIEAHEKRMAGGQCAYIDQLPFYATLTVNGQRVCSGALISLKHVLTAAHCVAHKPAKFYTRLAVRTGTDDLHHGGTYHAIRNVVSHNDFHREPKAKHDIAVIILRTEIHQTPEQKPIVLPNKQPIEGKNAVFAGFGYVHRQNKWINDVFQLYSAPLHSFEQCLKEATNKRIHEKSVCIIPEKSVRIQQGDSGGALVQDAKIVGVASWTNPETPNQPVIFVNVFEHLDFINAVVTDRLGNSNGKTHPSNDMNTNNKRPMSPRHSHAHHSKKSKH